MKRLIILVSVFFLMAATCQKPVADKSQSIHGKLVYRSCATIAVQVLDPNYYDLTVDEWQQAPDKPVFEHVFSVGNHCSFPGNFKPGDTFYFTVLKEDPANKDCVVCMLYDNPPAKKQLIEVIKEDN